MLRRQVIIGWCMLGMIAAPLALSAATVELHRPEVATLEIGASRIDWRPRTEAERWILTVSGPGDLYLRKGFGSGEAPHLSLGDFKEGSPSDGVYRYELRTPETPLAQSGTFVVKGGRFLAGSKPSIRKVTENLSDDDLIISGNACIGESCGTNSNDYPVLKLKGSQPNVLFDDIELPEIFNPANDWALFINPFETAQFSIVDFENELIPFSILGGAPDDSLFISDNGDVGVGTSTPAERFHILENADANTLLTVENPNTGLNALGAIRAQSDSAIVNFQAHGSGRTLSRFGQTLAGWSEFLQVTGNGFIIGTLADKPLILGTNSTNRVHITGSGNVGIGTASPSTPLHVKRSDGTAKVLVEEASGTTATRTLLELTNNGAARVNLTDSSVSASWGINNQSGTFNLIKSGIGFNAFSLQGNGNLTIAGTLTQGSDRNMKTDIVPVQAEEVLARLVSLPLSTWSRKDEDPGVRHLGPMAQDFSAIFGLGEDDRHIAPLDMAGVSMASIQALHGRMTQALAEKDAEIAQLRERLAALEELVSRLAAERGSAP